MRTSLLVFALLLSAFPVLAQQRASAVLNGIVRDSGGAPVPEARVQVADLRRSARTDKHGLFTLRALPVGDTLQVIVGRIGFRPMHLALTLTPGDNDLTVHLERIAQQLDAVRTVSEQTGVFGVVGDTAYEVISGATVNLTAGVGAERTTNELGQFAFESVKLGANFLEVRKPGYRPRLVSFMQPPRGGTKLVVWMTPWPPGAPAWWSEFPNRTVAALFDFKARARYKNSFAAIITRDMLAKYGIGLRLSDAIELMPASVAGSARARDFTTVIVDEVDAPGWTLQDFNADDVEIVELYPAGSDLATSMRTGGTMRRTRSMTSISGSGAMSGTAGNVARIWLRR